MNSDTSGPNNICKEHLAYKNQIKSLEENVRDLWKKWDSMQKVAYGILFTLISNLVAVIVLIIKGA